MLPDPGALKLVVDFLVRNNVPYMVIGGLANSVWGEVRLTRDADFKVSIGDQTLEEFRVLVSRYFPERQTGIPAQLQSAHIIHIWARPGVPVDLLVSIFDYERDAIERALDMTIEGVAVRVCTAEDLIIHKVVANREQDWIDIERVLVRQRSKLDQAYVLNWLTQFSEALEAPDLLIRYRQLRDRYDL